MKIPNTRITVKVGDHASRSKRNERENTLALKLRISCVRVPEIRYTINLVLKRRVSEALGMRVIPRILRAGCPSSSLPRILAVPFWGP